MVQPSIGTSNGASSSLGPPACRASPLDPLQRRELSLPALQRTAPVARLAAPHEVSRKFVYPQMAQATAAIDQAFPAPPSPADKVLFQLPVTKRGLEQLVLSLARYCQSPWRGTRELLETRFEYRALRLGRLSHLFQRAVDKAQHFHDTEALSALRGGAQEEIYQARPPVLGGRDVVSTSGSLRERAAPWEETTWGVPLLERRDRGFQWDYTLADAGPARRAGQKAAGGDLPCPGDLFPAEKSLTEWSSFLAQRARAGPVARQKIEHQYEQIERSCQRQTLGRPLYGARREEHQALRRAADVRVLVDWRGRDVLALAGPGWTERQER
jgi:hypothetical protein